jgi:hypothetical protein
MKLFRKNRGLDTPPSLKSSFRSNFWKSGFFKGSSRCDGDSKRRVRPSHAPFFLDYVQTTAGKPFSLTHQKNEQNYWAVL